jgi:tetratricopeptide (TPR) repeat protein
MNLRRSFWVFVLAGLYTACSHQADSTGKRLAAHCNDVDSLVEFGQSNFDEPGLWGQAITRLFFKGDQEGAERLVSEERRLAAEKPDKAVAYYFPVDAGYYYLWLGELDSVSHCLDRIDTSGIRDTNWMMAHVNLLGSFAYTIGDLELASNAFERGKDLATLFGHNDYRSRFSTNLGTMAYEKGYYRLATAYFSEALAIQEQDKREDLVLLLNLVACYQKERKFEEALALSNRAQPLVQGKPLNYNTTLYILNRAGLYQTMGQWEDAGKELFKLPLDSTHQSLQPNWLWISLRQAYYVGPDSFSRFLVQHSNQWKQPDAKVFDLVDDQLSEYFRVAPDWTWSMTKYGLDSLQSDLDVGVLASLTQVKAMYLEKQGNYKQATSVLALSQRMKDTAMSVLDSVRLADIASSRENAQLAYDLSLTQLELKSRTSEAHARERLLVFLSVFLVLISVLFYFLYKARTEQARLAGEEAKARESEAKSNAKLTALSKLIIEKSESVLQELQESRYQGDKHISNALKDLESLRLADRVVDTQMHPAVDTHDSLIEQFPVLASFSETEQKAFALFMDGYNSKEVAASLGKSYAYIRNMKSKLRKALELPANRDFTSLKS